MFFHTFLELVPSIAQTPLFGTSAHLKMVPLERSKYLNNYDYKVHNPRKSAVLSLFYPKDKKTYLLLIVRSKYPGVHSAQVSFPGGKMENFDTSLKATALRETYEEVGILTEKIEIIKECSEVYIPPSNFIVSPYIGITTEELETKIDTREVNQILEISLDDLLSDELIRTVEVSTSYKDKVKVPAFMIADHIVWGATAMILNEIKEIIHTTL